tara:strand:+ start:152 stop:280 length:129 start_codon:yes stop_codon:yes gene_type:complete
LDNAELPNVDVDDYRYIRSEQLLRENPPEVVVEDEGEETEDE